MDIKDKQKQIDEMILDMFDYARTLVDIKTATEDSNFVRDYINAFRGYATSLVDKGYCRLHEDDVIISKKEHERLKSIENAFEVFAAPDSILISKEEYDCLKKIEKAYDPFWFCAFGGCEGACKECKDTCEMSIFVKERKKFYDKFNENICFFKLENNSEEYKDGYIDAIADICDRLDKTAVELGVNIKE